MVSSIHNFNNSVSRKEGGRGLISSEDGVDRSIRRVEDHVKKNKERRITAIRSNTNPTINRTTINSKLKLEKMQLYGYLSIGEEIRTNSKTTLS